MSLPATSTRVLILGGGPAGATAASFLARDGIEVVLLEREVFPRYHIGESLLPSCLEIFDLVGAREGLEVWGGGMGIFDCGELGGRHTYSIQGERAKLDNLLLDHAAAQGAAVHQGVE